MNFDNINNSSEPDLVFNGINFVGGLLALAAQKSGIKVAIKLPQNLNFEFQPELSFYYPSKPRNTFTSLNNFRFLFKCSSLFPHLFYPQRVLSFSARRGTSKWTNSIMDKLLRHDESSVALRIETAKYKIYEPISANFTEGTLAYEYRFDRNRAVIELVRMCREEGVMVTTDMQSIGGGVQWNCIPFQWKAFSLTFENFLWPYRNNLIVEREGIHLTFQSVKNDTIVQFYLRNKNLVFDRFKLEVTGIFEKLKIPVPSDITTQLHQIYPALKEMYPASNTLTDPDLAYLRHTFYRYNRHISSQIGKKIKMNNFFHPFQQNRITAGNFRIIQSECDEKFDLAKQTGIAYEDFVPMFYGYRNQIDEMIEQAYELMNEECDSGQIWREVEKEQIKMWRTSLTN